MNFNISPEEVLKQKELMGGLQFDDPLPNTSQTGITQAVIESEIPQSAPVSKTESAQPTIGQQTNSQIPPLRSPVHEQTKTQTNLGKAKSVPAEFDTGWKNLPVSILPSRGIFYPEGSRIAIRAAEVKEIRYFSTIDDEDRLDIEDKLSYVLERCARIDFPGDGIVSFNDLKHEDRFFVIMAIRDLTFVKGENSIYLRPKKQCNQTPECPFKEGIELRTGVLSSYELDPKVMKFYDPIRRAFKFQIKRTGKEFLMYIPSIGVTNIISQFVINQTKKGNPPDDGFLKIAPFLFPEWRELEESVILNKIREIDYWSKEEYSLAFELSSLMKIGTELEVKQQCPICGGMEVTADISFPSGLRSLFVISDIFRELL